MFYTIYKVTNKVNGKIYIGVHKTIDVDDGYMGSGKIIKRAHKKYGIDNFEKEILEVFDNSEDMFNMESKLVNADFIKRDDNYNLKEGGFGGWEFVNENGLSTGTGFKFINDNGLNHKGNQHIKGLQKHLYLLENDPKYREKWLRKVREKNDPMSFKGKNHTIETKRKMSESHKGKHEGKKNSQYGTMWIHSLKEKRSKRIKKEDLPEWESKGWLKGRKMKFL